MYISECYVNDGAYKLLQFTLAQFKQYCFLLTNHVFIYKNELKAT